MSKTSSVSTSSIINSTPVQKTNMKLNPIDFIKNNLNKLKWILVGVIVIYFIYSFVNKESISNKVDKNLEDYKIVLDKDGNPVLLSINDIEKIKNKFENQLQQQMPQQQMPQQQMPPQQMPQQQMPQQQQLPQQQMPQQQMPQQQMPPQQMPQQQMPQQQMQPQQMQPQQMQPQQMQPEDSYHEEKSNTIDTINNILLEDSDEDEFMEDFNVKNHDLTDDEMNHINKQLDEII
jgi:FtsZ-interacting cell division protein ZipA